MRFLKSIENRIRTERDRHFSIHALEAFLDSIRLEVVRRGVSQQDVVTKTEGCAIYTTYCGHSKNRTFKPWEISADTDYFFVSNNQSVLKEAEPYGWKPIYLPLEVFENKVFSAYQAKIGKAIPHIFPALARYRYLMYVDDKIKFRSLQLPRLVPLMGNGLFSIGIREHNFLKKNVLQEFAEALGQKRYKVLRDHMIAFITKSLDSGLDLQPERIYWTSAILRDNLHKDTIRINEDWYKAILECGINCQLSFNFIAQRYESIAVLPEGLGLESEPA
jgi:hypothetical protein